MKKNFTLSATATTLALFLLITGANLFVSAHDDDKDGRYPSIEGVWRTAVTPRNCATGVPAAPTFPGLFTFNKGGTMAEWGVGPGQTPALRSPGHGLWQRERHGNEFTFTFMHYRYNASGAFIGTQTINAQLVLNDNGDEFTTTSSIEVRDVNGEVVGTGCAMAVGTRFE